MKDRLLFFEGDGSRGSAAFDDPATGDLMTEVPAPTPVKGEIQAGTGGGILPPHEPPTTPVHQFDPNAFATTFAKEIGTVFKQNQSQPPPPAPLSEADAKKLLNVFDITPEWLAQFDNMESRTKALIGLRDGLIRQADTITQYRLQEATKALEDKFTPMMKQVEEFQRKQQEADASARESRFTVAYPVLANKGLRPVLVAVAQELTAKSTRYASEEEQFKALAAGVEAVIKVTNPAFTLGAATLPKTKTTNGIPTTTPGSGGVGSSNGGTPTKSKGMAVFD